MRQFARRSRLVGLVVLAAAALIGFGYGTRARWQPRLSHALGYPDMPAAERWACPMHPEVQDVTQSRCPKCGMKLERQGGAPESAASTPAGTDGASADPGRAGVSLDTRRQQLIGVRTIQVARGSIGGTLQAAGIVRLDETRQFDVNVKVEGWIRELYVDYTGKPVRQGDPLFLLYSPDLLATQNEFLLALKTRESTEGSQVADARDYAARMVDVARQRLRLWDVSEAQIAELERTRSASPELLFRSPASGIVLEKRAVNGMRVMPGESLFRLADLSTVWVEADFYEAELTAVRVGSRASVTLEAFPGETFAGRASYVFPVLDEATRTVKVRLSMPNPAGRLKPGMYAQVALSQPERAGILVPRDALLDSGTRQFVFLAKGDGYFEPRAVRVGRRLEDQVEVLDGLTPGDTVASAATFFIDSESQMNAALQGFTPAQESAGGPSGPGAAARLRTTPDPPRAGENEFEVTVLGPDGTPLDGDDATVVFSMPPMPSMNMPAMRSDARLARVDRGVYRGRSELMMSGRWDLAITVNRSGSPVGTARLTVLAR